MITKTGFLIGAVRAGNLSDEQKAALRKHYGLADDSNLMLRNMGRDVAGGYGGLLAGGMLGGAVGGPAGVGLGSMVGSLAGQKLMTDKYSTGNAKKIMKSNQPVEQ